MSGGALTLCAGSHTPWPARASKHGDGLLVCPECQQGVRALCLFSGCTRTPPPPPPSFHQRASTTAHSPSRPCRSHSLARSLACSLARSRASSAMSAAFASTPTSGATTPIWVHHSGQRRRLSAMGHRSLDWEAPPRDTWVSSPLNITDSPAHSRLNNSERAVEKALRPSMWLLFQCPI